MFLQIFQEISIKLYHSKYLHNLSLIFNRQHKYTLRWRKYINIIRMHSWNVFCIIIICLLYKDWLHNPRRLYLLFYNDDSFISHSIQFRIQNSKPCNMLYNDKSFKRFHCLWYSNNYWRQAQSKKIKFKWLLHCSNHHIYWCSISLFANIRPLWS